jgi:predicted Zn-dependent protease with MMP-like domain
VKKSDFEEIIRATLNQLPEAFQYALENVAIVVEDEPDGEEAGEELFGLYEGVSLLDRGAGHMGPPDRIRIFRGPILRACRSKNEVASEIRDTLIHELGHHMGLEEDDMPY